MEDTATTTVAAKQMASVPPGPEPLPEGWTWWKAEPARDPRRRRVFGPYETERLTDGAGVADLVDPAGGRFVGDLVVLRRGWSRSLTGKQCDELVFDVVQVWGSHDRAESLLDALPKALVGDVMARVGYATPAHRDLVGEPHPVGAGIVDRRWHDTLPDDRYRRLWREVAEVEYVVLDVDEELGADGLAYRPRLARAEARRALPAGWTSVEVDDMAAAAPLELNEHTALDVWIQCMGTGRTSLTVIVVTPHERGWMAAVGIGGESKQLRGVYATREEAVAAADAVLAERRAPYEWAGIPAVRILEARSPGWDALQEAGQFDGPGVYGLAEIARATGVTVDAARKWQQRGQLPDPTAKLQAGWVWAGPQIEAWIREHARPGAPAS